ncbi:hypothetical protein ABEU20_004309 [Rhodococcus sp. PAM 2766]|uniref:Thioesterase domain-containing protein n=1 Tax=Rhodococcus parequi TaxID=3137122 RepID=A0ABW9FJD7_9NOCA
MSTATATPSATAQHWIDRVIVSSPVARHLGLRTLHAEVDRVDLALDCRDDLTFVTAATGRRLSASALVRHRTGSTTHCDVVVRDEHDTLVATATATSRIFS